ncbi:DUF4150 domain-containing protein [Buttiauxella agrestis]
MITININGLTLCHKGSGGVTHNTLPDVCKTPPLAIPIPFENEAYSSDLIKGTSSVFADGGNMIANYGSCFAKSVFDEPGSMGGVKSGTNRAEAEWISHSFDVFFEGKPACRLTDKMFMNHRNTVNMAGLCQPELTKDELDEEICKMARECYIEYCNRLKSKDNPDAKYAHYQNCLEDKLRSDTYDGRYPKKDSKIWTEVHFDPQGKLVWAKSGDCPSARLYTPTGGRRMDIIQLDSKGVPYRLIDVKFPNDSLDNARLLDYEEMAKKLKSDYETFDVTKKCEDWPKKCPNEKKTLNPNPEILKALAEELKKQMHPASETDWTLIGLQLAAIAASISPVMDL